jgi:hypothetical protein
MPHIDPGKALTIFLGNVPTFLAVVLAWMHSNVRMSDLQARMSDMNASLSRRIDDTRDLLRAEFRRVEEVMDARIKHLEEHD